MTQTEKERMINRLRPSQKVLELPVGFHEEIDIHLDDKIESMTQFRPEQIVTGIFEHITVNKDGTIKYGFKLLDVCYISKFRDKERKEYHNTYIELTPKKLEEEICEMCKSRGGMNCDECEQ